MEIEAKFILPDEATLARLLNLEQLAGSPVGPARHVPTHDIYLDTPAYTLLAAGFSCRWRRKDDHGPILTLKSLNRGHGVLHRREEVETRLPADADWTPQHWPSSPAAALTLDLAQDAPLVPLFELHQERWVRLVGPDQHTPLIELSLDRVRFSSQSAPALLAMEAELLADAGEALLHALVAELQTVWQLTVDYRSKFEYGLALTQPALLARWQQGDRP